MVPRFVRFASSSWRFADRWACCFGKQDFVYLPIEDVYRYPVGQKLSYRYTNEKEGKTRRRYWTTACPGCPLKSQCTTKPERHITRWEHEHVLEAVQQRLDKNPQAMRLRRETAEHPFGTLKMRMGATHFLMKRLPKVATEMSLHALAYNRTRVMNIVGVKPLLAAIWGAARLSETSGYGKLNRNRS
jgi:Transposase DDE domain